MPSLFALLTLLAQTEPAPVPAPAPAPAPAPEHAVRVTFATSDASSGTDGDLRFRWHLGYEGRGWLTEHLELTALLSVLPTSLSQIGDLSSHVSARLRPAGWRRHEGFTLRLFPFSSARLRATDEPLLAWGDQIRWLPVPGSTAAAAFEFDRGPWFAQLGLKTGLQDSLENDRNAAVLGRVRWHGPVGLRVEGAGMAIPQRPLPPLTSQGILRPLWTVGGTLRLLHLHGSAPDPIVVPSRERDVAPEFFERLARLPPATEGLGWTVDLEGTALTQSLEDTERLGEVSWVPGWGARLRGVVAWQGLRVQAFGLVRDPQLIHANVPSFPPYRQPPDGTRSTPELRGELSADQAFSFSGVTFRAGAVAGLLLPATLHLPAQVFAANPPVGLAPGRRLVVRGPSAYSILRAGDDPRPIAQLNALLRVDHRHLSAVLEAGYRRDDNRTTFEDDLTGIAEPRYLSPHELSLALFLQARL